MESGMLRARKQLSDLHVRLAREGFSEVFVDQMTRDVVAVTRHCPRDRRSVIMVAHTAFFPGDQTGTAGLELVVEGELERVLLTASMQGMDGDWEKDKEVVNGLELWKAVVDTSKEEGLVKVMERGDKGQVKIDLSGLVPGSVAAFAINPKEMHRKAFEGLRSLDTTGLKDTVSLLSLLDIQFALFQCDQEGRESGFGCYDVPGWRQLHYCGLAGIVPVLDELRPFNDLGHPLMDNVRSGDWYLEYTLARLRSRPSLSSLAEWLSVPFALLKLIPQYLIPRYLDTTLTTVYGALTAQAYSIMSPFIRDGSNYVRRLALGSVIHCASVPSAPLPPLSPKLSPPPLSPSPTLAAGLPHFSVGYMRSWGRDTFISLRGTLLVTGRFHEARDIILGYAATLRHGLIPNLLDGGKNARFNCRDAVWWWLRAILDYIEITDDGGKILKDPVERLYPEDGCATTQPLEDVVAEALSIHVAGLKFRERNAGVKIDE